MSYVTNSSKSWQLQTIAMIKLSAIEEILRNQEIQLWQVTEAYSKDQCNSNFSSLVTLYVPIAFPGIRDHPVQGLHNQDLAMILQ